MWRLVAGIVGIADCMLPPAAVRVKVKPVYDLFE
jgi:hypothetical protein